MDRLNQLRAEPGGSRDSTLDTSSPPSEAFMTANESSSKYFSLSEVDSTFDISPIKDISLPSTSVESEKTITESDQLISNLSPIGKKSDFDTYKIGKQIEAANILSGGVDIFDDNDNSYDGDELVIDDNAEVEEKSNPELKVADPQHKDENSAEGILVEVEAVPGKDTEVILRFCGKRVDAIDIGNGLYLYRKKGQEELAAVQIIHDDEHPQPTSKFLKVRENNEGNLEVYEEFQIEVPKEVTPKEEKVLNKNVSHVPIKDINKVISDTSSNKTAERKIKTQNVAVPTTPIKEAESEKKKEIQSESKPESNTNIKMKFSESRKSPVIGSFTPMTFHSTPNKEGIPLTKTMVDQQLHPNRHSDNVKKTIEVHTDMVRQRNIDLSDKITKDLECDDKNKQIEKENSDEKNTSELTKTGNRENESKQCVDIETKNDDDEKMDVDNLVIDESITNEIINEDPVVTMRAENTQIAITKETSEEVVEENSININKKLETRDTKILEATNQAEAPKEDITESAKESVSPAAPVLSEPKQTQETDEKSFTEESQVNKIPETIPEVKDNVEKQPNYDEEKATKAAGSEQNIDIKSLKSSDSLKQDGNSQTNLVNKDIKVNDTNTCNLKDALHDKKAVDSTSKLSNTVDKSASDIISAENEIIEKTAEQGLKQDSGSIDSKKKELASPLLVTEDNSSKVSNVEQEKCTETMKTEGKAVIITKVDSAAKDSEINKDDKSLEVHKAADQEKLPDDLTKLEPKTKIEGLKDDQAIQALKKNVLLVEEPLHKVNTVPPAPVASKPPAFNTVSKIAEPLKNVSKFHTYAVKEKEKEVKRPDFKPITKHAEVKQNITQSKNETVDKKSIPKLTVNPEQKPMNNNHAPVPFGKWTDVNRQAFLNKIKESKVPTNSSNGKQIKNSNDLNRRDVLKKIDSQRQAQELANMHKLGVVKKESAFASKTTTSQETKELVKKEIPVLKNNTVPVKKVTKQEPISKPQKVTTNSLTTAPKICVEKKESIQRNEISNQDLIDKTIEGIINRVVPAVPGKNAQEEVNQAIIKEPSSGVSKNNDLPSQPESVKPGRNSLDDIEMKMNELHGIPFIERPPHELPHVQKSAPKLLPKAEIPKVPPPNKPSKIPNLLPFAGKTQKNVKENIIDVDSEEEVIEHEPITGDMDLTKTNIVKFSNSEKISLPETVTLISADSSKKETIITENDFDKFVRRNSINYEDCLTVNFDIKETHNVVQTLVQKEGLKTYSKSSIKSDNKLLSPRKHENFSHNSVSKPILNTTKFVNVVNEDDCNKNYQSKVKMAYQTAMTAKRQLERPITIIEDRPVKVVYMDSNPEYVSAQLDVQGQELSPAKKPSPNIDSSVTQISDSLDSDTLDSIEEGKAADETKVKTKHQRKQVLTPVEIPELELIAPDDLGLEVSPKKKRRTEEKVDKPVKTLAPKKTYLYGRGSTTEDSSTKPFDLSKSSQKETPKSDASAVSHKNTASAIDSLVKAAELLENQSVSLTSKSPDVPQTPDSQQNTPVKRGRGRPRKYPLPESTTDKAKVPSPQKKPRLIDAKVVKNKDTDDDNDDDTSDDEMIKENWTMGKINENIVCPICNKLFRSENVVFKHVKHCTGPSPSRSDSDNKSPRRLRDSQESETPSFESKSDEMDIDESSHKDVRKKRKSRELMSKTVDKNDIIVIEDTPVKPKTNKRDETKQKPANKNKVPDKVSSLICEFCGKTFRQLSYLVNHKLQHEKDDTKKNDEETAKVTKSVFSCEVCKKEFRKLHHLVQHRLIHNPSNASGKMSRKSSSEQSETKTSKDSNTLKQSDDQSAGFRCEPCDKSFRKLHHLVEHRETHDGINRQKTTTNVPSNTEKLPPPPQCDVCKKTFRKLHHLIEHKEQHLETLSEKSDDKSIKSSLSTKDIIHECSLCYMVFPNEHSLNKHTVICQRKKRQSATKQQKQSTDGDKPEGDKETIESEENTVEKEDDDVIVMEEIPVINIPDKQETVNELIVPKVQEKIEENIKPVEINDKLPTESLKTEDVAEKSDSNNVLNVTESKPLKIVEKAVEDLISLSAKIKKAEDTESKPKVQDMPKKKTPVKDKGASTVTKRHKSNLPLPVIDDTKPAESSDDDEIRYMLNPDYKFEDNEGKLFMKVRANKRNSLQIERPNSKDLVKRRISLQHPPKVPRLKPKPIQIKTPSTTTAINTKTVVKAPKLEPVPSTDSDDSDVKYSFPDPVVTKTPKTAKKIPETSTKEPIIKAQRKSLAEKRKSLSSIAKLKSLGKAGAVKHKVKASPLKQVRKRTAEIEHRCDCGQLFSSAALLSRHTSLAHTPPRVRRRRSPLPEVNTTTVSKPAPNTSVPATTRPSADSRKSSGRSDVSTQPKQPTTKRKSSVNKPEPKTPNDRKSPKSSDKSESVKSSASNVKLRRYAAHKGVPVPEKMRKLMEKSKK